MIVESPAKARTVENILGSDYRVIASVGHVRDLPNYGYGVEDVKSEKFDPKYVLIKGKEDIVKEIAAAARHAERVYLSARPRPRRRAISWPRLRKRRYEKTTRSSSARLPAGHRRGVPHPGKLNMDLVDAPADPSRARPAHWLPPHLVGAEGQPE